MEIQVTVGVCVKNSENIVLKALGSIIRQNYPHRLMELILVDDGSTDRTLCILENFVSETDIRTKVHNNAGRGLGYSRQIVVNEALGKYIVWVDGDMKILPETVKKHVQFMEKNPDIGIACGKEIMQGKNKLVSFLESLSYQETGIKALGGAIYRVKAIRQVGGFDTHIYGAGEDKDLINRMYFRGWKIAKDCAEFYHDQRVTWSALWNKYLWFGYGSHYVFHKHNLSPWRKTPIVGIVIGLRVSLKNYKKSHRKSVFLLPFHFFFKNAAWSLGYINAHIDGYGHNAVQYSSIARKLYDRIGSNRSVNHNNN